MYKFYESDSAHDWGKLIMWEYATLSNQPRLKITLTMVGSPHYKCYEGFSNLGNVWIIIDYTYVQVSKTF